MGCNSGVAVEELPKSQCAFANNATFRGDFATDRPPVRKIKVSADIDSLLQDAFKQGLFQGASNYKPDGGFEQLACSIAGRLFVIEPNSTDGATGKEITIAGDLNSANLSPVWMDQAERWLIINDGSSVPIFYDGTSSRRSEVDVVLQGTTSADFVTPPIGGTVDITLAAPYTGLLNSVLNLDEVDTTGNVIRTAHFMVTKVNGNSTAYTVVLKNLSDTEATEPISTQLVIRPQNLGYVSTFSHPSFFDWSTESATLTAPVPSYVAIGNKVQIGGDGIWTIQTISADRKTLGLKQDGTNFSGASPKNVILLGSTLPDAVAGVLGADFTVPPIGSNATASLVSEYTNLDGQILFLNSGQYQVISHATSPPVASNSVTVQNLNDDISTSVKSGSKFYNLPELPIGRMGTYGMGRVAQSGQSGISFLMGDIVGGSSGSPAYDERDAVLKVTENLKLANGGEFNIPSSGDTITALLYTATMDKALGQGALQIFTNKNVFSCNAPADRTTWQNLTTPIETQSLKGAGASSQWAVTNENSDILFRCPTGELRSMLLAQLNFNKWGNTPISREMQRVIVSENRSFLNFDSAIEFDNRWLVASNPVQSPNGIYWQGLMAMNFDTISSLQGKSASIFDGLWTGLNVLQLVRFKSVERAFAFCVNTVENKLEIWEFLQTGSEHFDDGKIPIPWSFETPAFFLGATTKYRGTILRLDNGAISVRDIIGRVNFKIQYRMDNDSCWHDWHKWPICAKQSTDPNVTNPQYRKPMSFGNPSMAGCNVNTDMPPNLGDFAQVRVFVEGHCVVTKIELMASLQSRPDFTTPLCQIQ